MAWKEITEDTDNATDTVDIAEKSTDSAAEQPLDDNALNLDIDDPDDMISLIEDCTGRDENGHPNASLAFAVERYDEDAEEIKTEKSVNSVKGDVKFFIYRDIVRVDVVYPKTATAELRHVRNLLSTAEPEKEEKGDDSTPEKESPLYIRIVITPLKYKGRFVLSAFNPVFHVVQAENEASHECTMTLVFYPDNIGVYDTGKELDMKKVEANADRLIRASEESALYLAEKQEKQRQARKMRNTAETQKVTDSHLPTDIPEEEGMI